MDTGLQVAAMKGIEERKVLKMSYLEEICPIMGRVCNPNNCAFYDLDKHYCLLVNAVNPTSTTSLTALLKRIGSTLDRMEYEG